MNIIKRIFKTRPPVIELWQSSGGKWYFHQKASNGRITAPSQGYSTKSNAIRAARKIFPNIEIVEL